MYDNEQWHNPIVPLDKLPTTGDNIQRHWAAELAREPTKDQT